MAAASTTQFIARTCGSILLVVTVAYILFAVAPYYANGIHLRSYQEIAGSFVDVKGYPPFTWLGGPAQAIAMLAAGFAPWLSALLLPVLAVVLVMRWRLFSKGEVVLWLSVAAATLLAVGLTWSMHTTLMIWLVD